jgi:SAM-dependent methyltransferase
MWKWLKPAWPDEGRLAAQLPTLNKLAGLHPFAGICLNAGCGEGLYCRFLESFENVTRIVNVDLTDTPKRLSHLTDKRHSTADASLTALPFQDASFDCCLCTEVLEHIADDDAAVRELSRCLRLGGVLLASVPHPPAPFDPSHVREGYSLEQLTDLFGRHGMRVVASKLCFSVWMSSLLKLWRWQECVTGTGGRNLIPRALVRGLATLDRTIPIGHRWDLAVLAVKK